MSERKSESAPFFITLLERIGGADVPVMSTADERMQKLTAAFREIAQDVMTPAGEFVIENDDDEPGDNVPESAVNKFSPGNRVMGKLLGNAPEIKNSSEDRERKTLAAVTESLMRLSGESRNFSCVMEILLERWNSGCLSHLNDKLIASIVRTLLMTDEGASGETVNNKITALIGQIDEKTDYVSEFNLPAKQPVVEPKILPFKKVRKAVNFRQ